MISGLKSYPKYKPSSQAWLGDVPQHWLVVPNRALFAEVNERNHPDEELLSVTINRGIVRQASLLAESSKRDSSKLDKSAYKLVCPRDIAYNKMRAWQGAIGASDLRGIISPAYVVVRLRKDDNLPRYFHHLYRTPQFAKEAERWSYGITSDMWSLRPEHFRLIYTLEPPPPEQEAVVRFLDYTNGRLERVIQAKRKVIGLLNEQKEAIIQRAVTQSLNAVVPLKPSGIPWLGQIPQHWKVKRAKYLYREVDERSRDGAEELLSVSHLTGVTPRSQKNITMFKAASYVGHKLCRPGDLVVNTMWAWMGALGVSTYAGIVSPSYAVYRPHGPDRIVGCYMDGLLRSRLYISNIICRSRGLHSSRLRLYPEEFFRLPIIQPPPEEQQRIVEAIQTQTADLNTATSRLEREIGLIREYRTRLVADVVTGKLDVREAAARLPDVAASDDITGSEDADLIDEADEAAEAEPIA
jgi:type I restriction enzyme S subunit